MQVPVATMMAFGGHGPLTYRACYNFRRRHCEWCAGRLWLLRVLVSADDGFERSVHYGCAKDIIKAVAR